MSSRRWELLLKSLLLFVLLAVMGGALVKDFRDSDFFWHLKSGEWIWEHRALPDEFLFVSPPPATPAVVQRFTMTSYWIMQILLHLAHAAGGMAGIVVLRFVFAALLLLALFSGKDGDDLVFLGLLVFAVVIFVQYPAERPQYISFVFFGFLLVLLKGINAATPGAALLTRGAAIPVLMVVWANCHGGYIVGLGIMAAWLCAESLKYLHPLFAPLPPKRYRFLVGSAVAGFLASLLNPNTYHVFEVAFQPAEYVVGITEYLSAIESYRLFGGPAWLMVYFTLLGLAFAGLCLSWRRPDLTSIVLLALTGYHSFTRVRFVPFFVVAALFVLCRVFSAPYLVRKSRFVFAVAGLALGIFFLRDAAPAYRAISRCTEVNNVLFPVEAASFIQERNLAGNMFNYYNWGGYLLWRLAPAQVFIDGRNADRDLYVGYSRILQGEGAAAGHGPPFWKTQLQRRGIRFTVTPIFDPLSGVVFGLLDKLIADPAWVPVFVSATTVVFAENVPVNRAVVSGNSLPKEQFFPFLLKLCTDIISVNPGFVQAFVARGDLLLRLGDRAGALRSFEEALRMAPQLPYARARVERLRARRE